MLTNLSIHVEQEGRKSSFDPPRKPRTQAARQALGRKICYFKLVHLPAYLAIDIPSKTVEVNN